MFAQTSLLALAALLPLSLAQISDDFESGWDQTKWPVYAPDCNQGGSVALDSTVAHSGKNSIKVTGGSGGYCGHIFFGNNASIPTGTDVYVRAWIRHAQPVPDNHNTFITMPDSSISGKRLRVSTQMGIIEYNRESDDATLPSLSPDGIAASVGIPVTTWECLEYHLSSDGTIETWFNGNAVAGLTVKPGVTNANAGGWGTAYKPSITGVYFGWESYSGSVDTYWYDDVAIAASRVGCSAAGASSGGSSTAKPTTTAQPTTATSVKPTTTTSVKPTTTSITSVKPTTSSVAPTTSSIAPTTRSVSSIKPTTSTKPTTSAAPTSAKPSTTTAAAPSSTDDGDCEINYVTVYV